MPSHGALKEQAATAPVAKKRENFLRHIRMEKAANGGVIAHHEMNDWDAKAPVHAFGADEGSKLAAHIEKHLGIKMPGKSGVNESEPREGDENEE